MNAVEEDVKTLVEKELESANTRFPAFRSAHEGWAVMREELDELGEECDSLDYISGDMWTHVKNNDATARDAEGIMKAGIRAACEAIQVAAMARKYLDMLEAMDDEKEA